MADQTERENSRKKSRSTRVDRQAGGPRGRVVVLQRKARYQGPWGRIQRAFRDQRSPLTMGVVLVVAVGLMASVLFLIGRGTN